MKKHLLAILTSLTISFAAQCQGTDLFFSEYLEGASNNKAIEIYNPTNAPISLSNYVIYRYNNGSPTPTDSLFMPKTIAPGGVYVAGNPTAIAAITGISDTMHTITFFNGDDAMALKKISTGQIIDVIGLIGNDPGTNWVVGTGATSEFTLVRKATISGGTADWAVGATQWDVYPQNTTTYLGSHTMNPLPVKLTAFTAFLQQNKAVINWKVEEQEGIDTYEVQRSSNGINFNTIATVAAQNARSYTYQFTDGNLLAGNNYYRLKINERQLATYSRTINLNAGRKTAGITIYPTITSSAIQLQSKEMSLLNEFAQIYSNNGTLVKAIRITQLPMTIAVDELAKGQYVIKSSQGVQSFIKQ